MNELLETPLSLQTIKSPPKKLFFIGNQDLLNKKKISIVGTRRPISYTKGVVFQLSQMISKNNGVVVSGGAMGVDEIAHLGAMNNTIMVSPSSLDIIYPKTNQNIIQKIYNNALAISEYEKNYPPKNYSFVQRNRLVVGLGDVLVIAECDLNSGSLRSSEFAIKEGKKIYVLPHRINESLGTQYLIKTKQAEVIYDLNEFVNTILGVNSKECEDEILNFCKQNNSYDDCYDKFGEQLLMYEIEGLIKIENSIIKVLV